MSDTVIEFNGLTVVQVSQNQAAVVSDPQNHVFVIKNSGFVAYAIEGTYKVLSIVDQTHLPTHIVDKVTGITLGWSHEVRMKSRTGSGTAQDYVVALLCVSSRFVDRIARSQLTWGSLGQLEHTREQLCDLAAGR